MLSFANTFQATQRVGRSCEQLRFAAPGFYVVLNLAESGQTGGQALRDVLGLVARRQAALWKDWRPWVALIGLAPAGALLSLISRRVADGSAIPIWMYLDNWTWAYVTNTGARSDLLHYGADIITQYLVLACWSWASGLLLGSLARRSVWVNGTFFCLVLLVRELLGAPPFHSAGNAAVFSLTFYNVIFPLIVLIVLVLFPAIWGMHQGRRLARVSLLLQTIIWAAAIVTLTALALDRNRAGFRWQIRTLPVAVVGPFGYTAVMASWRRWRGQTAGET